MARKPTGPHVKAPIGTLISLCKDTHELDLSTSADVYVNNSLVRDVMCPARTTGLIVFIHDQWLAHDPEMYAYTVLVTLSAGLTGTIRLSAKEFDVVATLESCAPCKS